MVSRKVEPATLMRIGGYSGDLENAVQKYHEKLLISRSPDRNIFQYSAFNKNIHYLLLLMATPQHDELSMKAGYNLILTVTSYSKTINRIVADNFQKQTGIDLSVDVPEELKNQFNHLNSTFKEIDENPGLYMVFFPGKESRMEE